MDLTIPNENDKDKQIEFLKEALREVKVQVKDLPNGKTSLDDVDYCQQRGLSITEKIDSITSFIDKRLLDVSY